MTISVWRNERNFAPVNQLFKNGAAVLSVTTICSFMQ